MNFQTNTVLATDSEELDELIAFYQMPATPTPKPKPCKGALALLEEIEKVCVLHSVYVHFFYVEAKCGFSLYHCVLHLILFADETMCSFYNKLKNH